MRDESQSITSNKSENAALIEGIDCYGNERQVLHEQSKFFNNPWLSDITIRVGDDKFFAHKLILVRASEVFERMLSDEWNEKEKELNLVEEKECVYVFTKFLRYLYGCHIILNAEDTLPILVLSDKYNVPDLRQVAIQYAITNLIPRLQLKDLFHIWFQYATKCYHTTLIVACVSALAEKMDDITSLEEWKTEWNALDKDQMLEILKCSDLVIKDEYQLWLAVERWLLAKITTQKSKAYQLFIEILPYVRFPMMTSDQLCEIEKNSKLAYYFPTFFAPHLASAYKYQALSLTSLAAHFNSTNIHPGIPGTRPHGDGQISQITSPCSSPLLPDILQSLSRSAISNAGIAAIQRSGGNSNNTTTTLSTLGFSGLAISPGSQGSQDGSLGVNGCGGGNILLNPNLFPPIPIITSVNHSTHSSQPGAQVSAPHFSYSVNQKSCNTSLYMGSYRSQMMSNEGWTTRSNFQQPTSNPPYYSHHQVNMQHHLQQQHQVQSCTNQSPTKINIATNNYLEQPNGSLISNHYNSLQNNQNSPLQMAKFSYTDNFNNPNNPPIAPYGNGYETPNNVNHYSSFYQNRHQASIIAQGYAQPQNQQLIMSAQNQQVTAYVEGHNQNFKGDIRANDSSFSSTYNRAGPYLDFMPLTFIENNIPSSFVYLLRNYTEIRWDRRILINNVSKLQKFAELGFWITTRSSNYPDSNWDWEIKIYPKGFSPTNETFRCLLYSNLIFDQPRSVEYCLSLVSDQQVIKSIAGKKNFAKTRYTADTETEKRVDLSDIITTSLNQINLNNESNNQQYIINDQLIFQLSLKPIE